METLDRLYSELDFNSGSLYSVDDTPENVSYDVWLEKGEWLSAAKRAGADKLFFIDNNPIAVFAECGIGLEEKLKTFNRVWSLARPRLLFLVSPGEINVYDLAQKPASLIENDENRDELNVLITLRELTKVTKKLQDFHRDNIESGKLFEDSRFGDINNRADKSLIRDLKIVRHELIQAGLSEKKIKYAHALIGRSIFIRYLEDRQILTEDYFRKVARQKAGWTNVLNYESSLDISGKHPLYPRVLENKEFTYALFRTLARDFNGDMFPDDTKEEKIVKQKHLMLIKDLLYGDIGAQRNLFLKSYCFDIVPLDLISSIYEEFYHPSIEDEEKKQKIRQDGVYYTPPVLAEFVLSRTLTANELEKNPRVFDPACGSGIFLVEAFRRIVRYKRYKNNKPLTFDELKNILRNQIAGIEINVEAARIAAFSLYLSMLHYLEPPSIYEQIKLGNKLPNLIATQNASPNSYHCIWVGNAFDDARIKSSSIWRERFGSQSVDIVVGNPPWGAPSSSADQTTRIRQQAMLSWCIDNDKPISDKEPSQAFIWRALDYLREGGKVGMLVSYGILFKHNRTAQEFRNRWMDEVRVKEVINFAHVRKLFFKGVNSPFIAVFFDKGKQNDLDVLYWSAKQVAAIREIQAVLISKYDVHVLRNENLSLSKTWKNYYLGRHADWLFLNKISQRNQLSSVVDHTASARGFQVSNKSKHAGWLLNYKELPVDKLERYNKINSNMLIEPPKKVEHRGANESIYHGRRILIKRGIQEKREPKGHVISNLVEGRFCFRNSIHCLKLINQNEDNYLLLQGILWSSFARYFFFFTTSNWGFWHHEIHLNEVFELPIGDFWGKFDEASMKVISIVKKLRSYQPQKSSLLQPDGFSEIEINDVRCKLEKDLDEAVFELYELDEEQKDLVRDCCEVTIPFFYNPLGSEGVMQAASENSLAWIEIYAKTFSKRWNTYLREHEEMRAEAHVGAHGNLLAIEFFPADKDDDWNLQSQNDSWEYILDKINKSLLNPMGTSQILLESLVRVISDDVIIIIKRNERRFWTRSLAREDADATLCTAMKKDGKQ